MATIYDFKTSLSQGGARPNHFRVTLTSPGGNITSFDDKSVFYCKAASLPASTVIDIPVMYRGREVHFAGERTFAPWTVTVINELDFKVRNTFERWLSAIQHNEDTSGREWPTDYQVQLKVEQLSRDNLALSGALDAPVRTYYFEHAYPIEVGEIALSYDIPNAVEEFPVTFVYDYFTYE